MVGSSVIASAVGVAIYPSVNRRHTLELRGLLEREVESALAAGVPIESDTIRGRLRRVIESYRQPLVEGE